MLASSSETWWMSPLVPTESLSYLMGADFELCSEDIGVSKWWMLYMDDKWHLFHGNNILEMMQTVMADSSSNHVGQKESICPDQ